MLPRIGLTLPNQGVRFGVTSPRELIELAVEAEACGAFRSVWVGDSLLAKPRLESIVLLSAIASRTERVRLGTACMASFPVRDPILLAQQWASLDLVSGGRTVLIACTGINPQEATEDATYGVDPRERANRMGQWITLIRRLWSEDGVEFEGESIHVSGVTLAPRPLRMPEIWIANDARGSRDRLDRIHTRIARYADGWQIGLPYPAEVTWRAHDIRAKARALGRDPDAFSFSAYHNINIQDDRDAALEESKRFLDTYYSTDFDPDYVAAWTAAGTPRECTEHLRPYFETGVGEVALRITSWDQRGQLSRLIAEVAPLLEELPGIAA
jgi:alkanesulfonate monooxygenase SsuD/methylene tetrahydromethanopterin reductase-like flavin-dependent oxidoreductase (luciferase family)